MVVSLALSFVVINNGDWLGINDILLYFWYFALGVLFVEIKPCDIRNKLLFGCLLIAVAVALFTLNTGLHWMTSLIVGKVIGVMMVYGTLLICKSVSDWIHIPKGSPIRETYTMFILSWPCQLVCEVVFERILHLPIYVTMPMQFLTGVFITILLIYIINWFERKTKTRVLSLCLGR